MKKKSPLKIWYLKVKWFQRTVPNYSYLQEILQWNTTNYKCMWTKSVNLFLPCLIGQRIKDYDARFFDFTIWQKNWRESNDLHIAHPGPEGDWLKCFLQFFYWRKWLHEFWNYQLIVLKKTGNTNYKTRQKALKPKQQQIKLVQNIQENI